MSRKSRRRRILDILQWLVTMLVAILLFRTCAVQLTPTTPTPTSAVFSTLTIGEIITTHSSNTVRPGAEITMSIDVTAPSSVAISWAVNTGDGEILEGQGTPVITYEAPSIPGTYRVRVRVEDANSIVERSVFIRVEVPPTDTPISPTDTLAPPPSTNTPLSLTDTPTAASILATPTSTTTHTPTSTPTKVATTKAPTATNTPALPIGQFTLIKPVAPDNISYGPTVFEWRWDGPIGADQGFEVRVWREGEPPAGVHNAVEDNKNGKVVALGNNTYRLTVDIRDAYGVQGRSGEYLWTVLLVQISPDYKDLGIQAVPGSLLLAASDSGGDGDYGGGDSGHLPPDL
jgi:hypothetical protein